MNKTSNQVLEACVYSYKEAINAQNQGANRIELCASPELLGTTPSKQIIMNCKQDLKIPLIVMIRPRGGDFNYSDLEFQTMLDDIKFCKELKVSGIVIGILTNTKEIDVVRMQKVMDLCGEDLEVAFHMAFDETNDMERALQDLIKLNIKRILTKGGQVYSADEGKDTLKALIQSAQGQITIMPGGGITNSNYHKLMEYLKCNELHGTKIVGTL